MNTLQPQKRFYTIEEAIGSTDQGGGSNLHSFRFTTVWVVELFYCQNKTSGLEDLIFAR
jgi:hypothetical protein